MNTGERLRRLRKEHGFTQTQIADYLGFQQGQIAKLENNQRKLKESSLEKLCELYNCDENYILHGYGKGTLKFKSNVKELNLNTIVNMNRIISNVEYLADIMEKYGVDMNE